MFKTLLKHVGEYRKSTILTPILSMLEVFMEILIPYVIALIIDRAREAYRTSWSMVH